VTIRKYTSFDLGISQTLLAADGFYGDIFVDMSQGTGRFGRGYAWGINDSIFNRDRYWSLDDFIGPTIFFTAGVMLPTAYQGNCTIYFWDSHNGAAASVRFGSLGEIYVYNSAGTLIAQTPIGVWASDRWFQFEMKVYMHNTAGTIEVRYNTKVVISAVAVDTLPGTSTGIDAIRFYRPQSTENNISIWFNELIAHDDQGSVNNDYLGNVNVNSQLVIGNGYANQFSIGGSAPAGTNWQSVLNTALDDTKYVYSPNVGDIDFYTPNPTLNSPVVYATQVKAAMRQDDSTQRIGRVGLRVGSTTYMGSKDFYLDQTYRLYSDMWELNPSTGVGWTGSEVNGIQIGVKVNA